MLSPPRPLAQDAPSHSAVSAGALGRTGPHLHSSPPERSSTLHTTRQLGSPGRVLDTLAWLWLHVGAWPSTDLLGHLTVHQNAANVLMLSDSPVNGTQEGLTGLPWSWVMWPVGWLQHLKKEWGEAKGPPGGPASLHASAPHAKHSLGVATPFLPGPSWPNSTGPFSSLSSIFSGRCGDDTHPQGHL